MNAPNEAEVVEALARRMHDLGVAFFDEAGVYPGDESISVPAVLFGELEPSPGRAVAIVAYDTDPDIFTVGSSPLYRFTLAWRADSWTGVIADAAAGFDRLHSLTPGLWPGGVAPLWMLRTINGKPEPDNGRWIKADSYDVRVN